MKLTAIENAKIFGDPQPHTFVSAASENGDMIVIKAHQAAKEAIKKVNPKIQVGITLSLHDTQFIEGGEYGAEKEWNEEFGHSFHLLRTMISLVFRIIQELSMGLTE